MLFVSVGSWLWQRMHARLPLYIYLAVTPRNLYALEFRFGPLRLRREVAVWAREEVRASRTPGDAWGLDLWIGTRKLELEAVNVDGRSARVLELLTT